MVNKIYRYGIAVNVNHSFGSVGHRRSFSRLLVFGFRFSVFDFRFPVFGLLYPRMFHELFGNTLIDLVKGVIRGGRKDLLVNPTLRPERKLTYLTAKFEKQRSLGVEGSTVDRPILLTRFRVNYQRERSRRQEQCKQGRSDPFN